MAFKLFVISVCALNLCGACRYLDRWSDLRTWLYQEPPVEEDFVVVPDGQTVLLDVSPPKLFVLLIQGRLVFDRQDLTLNSSYILIAGGQLEVGTPAEPFLQVCSGWMVC